MDEATLSLPSVKEGCVGIDHPFLKGETASQIVTVCSISNIGIL